MSEIASNKAFGGSIKKYKATSKSLGGLDTQFNVYTPPGQGPFPVLYYLAGLTCNEDTGPWKGSFLSTAANCKIAMVFPDTSPRGAGIEGEDDDWDFGTGAGFYLDATNQKWSKHYNMFTFLTQELPQLLGQLGLPLVGNHLYELGTGLTLDLTRQSIFGHSMGGHGALTLYLSTLSSSASSARLYRSASAFAPIANPTKCPWGTKAFSGYLQGGVEEGDKWDATVLLETVQGQKLNILVDYGTADNFYKQGQLLPEALVEATKKAGFSEEAVKVRSQDGYDHSYYFISTFSPEHIEWHAKHLKA